MNTTFLLLTILFVIISVAMILIILVQRPQGGGLAGAFGGAGGGGSETVFGGRVGDALTWATVVGFVLYLGTAIALNKVESDPARVAEEQTVPMLDAPPGELPSDGVPQTLPTEPQPGPDDIQIQPPVIDPSDEPAAPAEEVPENGGSGEAEDENESATSPTEPE